MAVAAQVGRLAKQVVLVLLASPVAVGAGATVLAEPTEVLLSIPAGA